MYKYKDVVVETLEDTHTFFNVKNLTYNRETNSWELLSQNDDLHIFPRECVNQIIS